MFAADARGCVEMYPEYAEGLRDPAGSERIWLSFLLDRAPAGKLRVVPFRGDAEGELTARLEDVYRRIRKALPGA